MRITTPLFCPPPGADRTLSDLVRQAEAYQGLWMALVRYAVDMPAYVHAHWLSEVINQCDVLTLFALLRQRPKMAGHLIERMIARENKLRACPVWMHLVGEHPNSHHGQMALIARAQAYDDVAWRELVRFAMPLMNTLSKSYAHAAWVKFLDMPNPKDARRARKEARQRARGRTPGPVGGDDKRRPVPIS